MNLCALFSSTTSSRLLNWNRSSSCKPCVPISRGRLRLDLWRKTISRENAACRTRLSLSSSRSLIHTPTMSNIGLWAMMRHHHLPSQAQSSPGRHQRQAEAASGARIQRLNRDLASKTRTIQDLCRTVERLQKERRNVTSAPNPQAESGPTETKRLVRSAKPLRCSGVGGEETFPAARCEKTYQPTAFTGADGTQLRQLAGRPLSLDNAHGHPNGHIEFGDKDQQVWLLNCPI